MKTLLYRFQFILGRIALKYRNIHTLLCIRNAYTFPGRIKSPSVKGALDTIPNYPTTGGQISTHMSTIRIHDRYWARFSAKYREVLACNGRSRLMTTRLTVNTIDLRCEKDSNPEHELASLLCILVPSNRSNETNRSDRLGVSLRRFFFFFVSNWPLPFAIYRQTHDWYIWRVF